MLVFQTKFCPRPHRFIPFLKNTPTKKKHEEFSGGGGMASGASRESGIPLSELALCLERKMKSRVTMRVEHTKLVTNSV